MPTESWRIKLFGGLAARQGERVVDHFETRKVAALLACLCLPLDRAHLREALTEELWPGEEWDATRSRLRQTLSWLRRHLEPPGTPEGSVLLADRTELRLDPRFVSTDVADFEAALRTASHGTDPAERIRCLRQAIESYDGELLPGYYEERIFHERERLAEAYRSALGQLASALAQAGDLPQAIEYARRAVQQDPLREEAHADLMRLLADAGRTSEALRQYREMERALREDLGAAPSAFSRDLLERLRAAPPAPAERATSPPFASSAFTTVPPKLEPEGGAVPLDSAFYIVRPTDAEFETALARHDSLVLVKGPRQVGKTSLLARGLQRAREAGACVVTTDLNQLTPEQMETPEAFFETLAELLIDQLDLNISLETIWNPRRGWNVNFDRFLRHEVLARLNAPLVWGLDEVDRLFSYPFSVVVFGLFRSWHNARALNPDGPWGRLTLAIAYATEAHLFITDLNQSPFNVGTRLILEDFTCGEVEDLDRRYQSPLRDKAELTRYCGLVGGHPFLVRRGLYSMSAHGLDLDALAAQAGREDGVFGDHLRRLLASLTRDTGLCDAVRMVLKGQPCPDAESFYRLRSAGVLAGDSQREARLRCGLYRDYLQRRLN